jgi:hypothetical protein
VHDRELGVLGADETVDDFVDGSVTSDGDEEANSFPRGFARQIGQVAGPLREERVATDPALRGCPGDLRPAPSGRPVVGRRVDEEDRLSANASLT